MESQISRQSLNEAVGVVEAALKAKAPVAKNPPGYPTSKYGTLKDNIRVAPAKKIRTGFHAKASTGDAFWGLFLEFGTVKMKKKPWFLPAWDGVKMQSWDTLHRELKAGVEGAVK